ncbi:chaperone SurA [Mizugakiibacter sediminis]|uniref:Chaperone SurA n=1 Tax=Mizugakiibacter sediminis TaxID=1475481 RepID=A0A0K8QM95_9GAMM|nr:peptidylprolyl isomerase [Mizugakiibacter sediminis]GAP65999.1 chaperone SurA [Mizugakiibacter sediminis]
MKRIAALFLLALAGSVLPQARAQLLQPTQPLDRIVAVVNDDVILQSQLDQAMQGIQRQYANQPQRLPPQDILQRQVLERLVLERLQVQRANEEGIRVADGEVDAAIANIARQNNLTLPQLREALAQQGYDYAQYRNQLRDQILVQRLRQKVLQGAVQVSDTEIDNLLSSPGFKSGEVHLAHIVVGVPQGASADDIAKAQAKVQQVEADLKNGMDFAAAAIRYSDAPDALEGGDLGWRRYDEVPSAFVNMVADMQPGQVTDALRGPGGFQILKLIEKRDAAGKQMVTEYHARHIMVRTTELVTPQQAEQKARDLYQRIVDKHEDFAKLAKENSDDTGSANLGGDLGWFQQDEYGTAIGQVLAGLKDGEVSPPFQVDDAWHIVQRLGTREVDRSKEMQREQARQAIQNRKAEEAYDDFLRSLRADAYVDLRVGQGAAAGAGAP